ncbi:MAG: hypothetical protein ACOZQL_04700 [Myxococcota bacterium]
MRASLVVVLISLGGCRYLAAPTPAVSAERPALLSAGSSGDPTRQPASLPSNRCGVECGAGRHCDPARAECVADPVAPARDGGAAWLP